jgi:hypothetical protein
MEMKPSALAPFSQLLSLLDVGMNSPHFAMGMAL